MKSFIAGCIGGVRLRSHGIRYFRCRRFRYGITGLFDSSSLPTMYGSMLVILVAAAVAFFLPFLVIFHDEKEEKKIRKLMKRRKLTKRKKQTIKKDADNESPYFKEPLNTTAESIPNTPHTVYSPLSGTGYPYDEVKDPTFAAEVLGKGAAVVPSEGKSFP